MRLIYLDESECQQYDTYFVGALVAEPQVAHDLIASLDELGADLAGRFGLDARVEFHGYAMMAGTEGWEPMQGMKTACINAFERAVEAVADHDVKVCIRGLDVKAQKVRYPHPYPPHQVCLEQVVQRVHQGVRNNRDYGMLFADEHHLDRELRGKLRVWQRHGTTSDYMKTRPTRFLDTIHFTPSSESRMLQAVDLVLYYYQRKYYLERREDEGRSTHPKEAKLMQRLADALQPVLHKKSGVWVP